MDREERLQALNKIEGQLSQYLAADKKNWIQTYLLMSEVQDKELYIVNYRSYTKSKDGQIKVLQTADKLPAIMRDKTLNSLVLKLL